jgi:ubiquinone/menaquinone biosynthesis C-methylase UbiE
MDAKTIQAYNEEAENYDLGTKDFWDKFPRTFFDKFIELTKGKVLDIGSGPGRDGLMLKQNGLDITCLDASEAMIKLCQDKGLLGIVGDFSALSFEDESFDGIWSYTAWLHVPKTEIDQAVNEAARVLKPGGILGLGMIEGQNELYRVTAKVTVPRWFSFYTKEELEELLQKHGFEILYFETFKPESKNYLNFIAKKYAK